MVWYAEYDAKNYLPFVLFLMVKMDKLLPKILKPYPFPQ